MMKKTLFLVFLLFSLPSHAALVIDICGGANYTCPNNPNIPQQDNGAVSDTNATGMTAGSAVANSAAPSVNVPGASIGSLPPSGAPAAPMDPTLPVSASNPLCSTNGNQITCDGGVGPAYKGGGTLSAPASSSFDVGGSYYSNLAAACNAIATLYGAGTVLNPVASNAGIASGGTCTGTNSAGAALSIPLAPTVTCPSGLGFNGVTQTCTGSSPDVPAGMTEVQTPAQPATSTSPAVAASVTFSGTPSLVQNFAITGNNPSGVPGSIAPGTAAAASGTPSGSSSGSGSGSVTCPAGAICNTAGLAQDSSVQTLIQKVEAAAAARAADQTAAQSAASGFPSQPANGGLDASKVGLPTSSTFTAPVLSFDGLLPSSTTCVPIPTSVLGRAVNLDPCKVVTIAMPFINWAIITIGVIGGIGLILKQPQRES